MPTLPENNTYNRGYNNLTSSVLTKQQHTAQEKMIFQEIGRFIMALKTKNVGEIIRITDNPDMRILIQNNPAIIKNAQATILELIAEWPRLGPFLAKKFEFLTPDYVFNAFYGKLVPRRSSTMKMRKTRRHR